MTGQGQDLSQSARAVDRSAGASISGGSTGMQSYDALPDISAYFPTSSLSLHPRISPQQQQQQQQQHSGAPMGATPQLPPVHPDLLARLRMSNSSGSSSFHSSNSMPGFYPPPGTQFPTQQHEPLSASRSPAELLQQYQEAIFRQQQAALAARQQQQLFYYQQQQQQHHHQHHQQQLQHHHVPLPPTTAPQRAQPQPPSTLSPSASTAVAAAPSLAPFTGRKRGHGEVDWQTFAARQLLAERARVAGAMNINNPDLPPPPPPSNQDERIKGRNYLVKGKVKRWDGKRFAHCCAHHGCDKLAQGTTAFCKNHGGGARCQHPRCKRAARGGSERCAAHGGGKRCEAPGGCSRAAIGRGLCRRHGGGKACAVAGCDLPIRGKTDWCEVHGTGVTCGAADCDRPARRAVGPDSGFCEDHVSLLPATGSDAGSASVSASQQPEQPELQEQAAVGASSSSDTAAVAAAVAALRRGQGSAASDSGASGSASSAPEQLTPSAAAVPGESAPGATAGPGENGTSSSAVEQYLALLKGGSSAGVSLSVHKEQEDENC